MRIHRLEITAFGPFAERCVLDFDDLTDAGLFLVHGPTGAGKTSILDAVCFALYAAVPGARGSRPSLRSHHAGADAVPLVVLEFTAAGRRLRVTRQPAYSRPSRATAVPAKVALEELRAGRWRPLSSRHDEVGDVVNDVMGMGRQQFERVVLLPQGDFAAFLRSSAEDRRRVLDKLFDVSTFTDVEAWLTERRRALGAEISMGRAELSRLGVALADLLARMPWPAPDDDAVAPDLGEDLALLDADPDAERLGASLRIVLTRLDAAVTEAMAAHELAETDTTAADEAWVTAERTELARARGIRARAGLEALAGQEDELALLRARAAEAAAAAPLRGHLVALEHVRDEVALAQTALAGSDAAAAKVGLAVPPGAADVEQLLGLVVSGDDAVSRGRRLAEDWDRLAIRAAELAVTAQRRRADADRLTSSLAAAEDALGVLTAAHGGALVDAARLPAAEAEVLEAERLVALRTAWDLAESRLAEARDDLRERTDAEQEARDLVLGLRERRLDGMAAELAGSLTDGAPCPVCGSAEHPVPAQEALLVTAQDVAQAEAAHAAVARAREAAATELAALSGAQSAREAQLAGQRQTVGELGTVLSEARGRRETARERSLEATELAAQVQATASALDAGRAALVTAVEQATVAESAGSTVAEQLAETQRGLADVLTQHAATCPCTAEADAVEARWATTGGGEPTLDASAWLDVVGHVADRHADARGVLRRLAEARARLADRQGNADAASQALAAAVAAAGFQDTADVERALMPPEELAAATDRLRRHDDDRLRLDSALADPEVVLALAAPPVDLPDLGRRRQSAREAARGALRRHTQAQDAGVTGRRLVDELASAMADLGPRVDRHRVLTEVADAASGGGSNSLRMPLSSFVLAARLERVAELANERLTVMGEGRFELRHTDDRTGNAKSGLGLEVVDLWTGQTRSTSTLSGGESFMASLALALGLADAVREEAGGIDLQTLFIDEGFGTLDDESLEQVLAVLDTLRDGGRAVGVVSHVADLRTRIPRQVKVTKTPHGSSVTLLGADRAGVA